MDVVDIFERDDCESRYGIEQRYSAVLRQGIVIVEQLTDTAGRAYWSYAVYSRSVDNLARAKTATWPHHYAVKNNLSRTFQGMRECMVAALFYLVHDRITYPKHGKKGRETIKKLLQQVQTDRAMMALSGYRLSIKEGSQ